MRNRSTYPMPNIFDFRLIHIGYVFLYDESINRSLYRDKQIFPKNIKYFERIHNNFFLNLNTFIQNGI